MGQAREFAESCALLGVRAPEAIERGARQIDLIRDFTADQTPPAGLLSFTAEQIQALVVDLSVRRHESTVGANGLSHGAWQVEEQITREVREAVLPDLERVTEELRPVFDEAAAPIVAAAQRYGFTLATTSDEVINRADEGASTAWRNLRSAWTAVQPIFDLRRQMSEVFGVSPTRATVESRIRHFNQYSVNYSACFAAGENWSADDGFTTDEHRTQLDWLALAVGGLRLNSPAEVEVKIADRIKRDRQTVARAGGAKQAGERALAELRDIERRGVGIAR
ncbi:hypothetical protein [Microbacterium sp.]|uniref:hypothetical protein n=1 Tax=Microbacterium sp. TaxID=51671 RepID=UPI003C194322